MKTRILYGLILYYESKGKISSETLSIKMLDKAALLNWLDLYLNQEPALESMLTGYKITEEHLT